jgi:hypothetical protein
MSTKFGRVAADEPVWAAALAAHEARKDLRVSMGSPESPVYATLRKVFMPPNAAGSRIVEYIFKKFRHQQRLCWRPIQTSNGPMPLGTP